MSVSGRASQRPVFVVGPSRSGTRLMRTCLNGHSQMNLVERETHYFDDLRVKLAGNAGLALDDQTRRRCENYFLRLAHRPYGQGGDIEQSPITRADLRAAAADVGDGPDAYFEAFCRLQAGARGDVRWGEKTPRHVFRIAEILSAYPAAQVICMIRDPRAVVASYRDAAAQDAARFAEEPDDRRRELEREQARKARSYDALVVSLLWRSGIRAGVQAQRQFGRERITLQRFEDLVSAPEDSLRDLAAWLAVDFDPAMMDVPHSNSSYATSKSRGVSAEPARRWRQKLSPKEIRVVQSACRAPMREHGYAPEPLPLSAATVVGAWVLLPIKLYRAASANRGRAGSLPRYLWRRLRAALS